MAGTVSGDGEGLLYRLYRRQPGTMEQLDAQWKAFSAHYHAILQTVANRQLAPDKAREIIQLHYAPIKYHPRMKHPDLQSEIEWKLDDGLELAVERSQTALPESERRKMFIAEREAEARQQARERRRGRYATAFGFGAATLGYMIEKGCLSDIGRALHDPSAVVVGGMAVGSALLGCAVNAMEGRKQPLAGWYKAFKEAAAGVHARFGAGLIAIAALIGMFAGKLPPEYEPLLKPHKSRKILEAPINAGVIFHDELPDCR